MSTQEKWKWQEPGTTWKGAGLYHITLTVTDRQPVLGKLITPNGDPTKAWVMRSPFGDSLVDVLMSIPMLHPEVQVLHFCLMPDHLHAVLYVRRTMPKGIGALARGFWQAVKKLGRACTASSSFMVPPSCFNPNDIRKNNGEESQSHRLQLKAESRKLQELAASLLGKMGEDDYYRLSPIFTEMPFIRPMARYSQLPNTIRYIDMNPQRLATKRIKPGFFRVQQNITIGNRSYDGVGNVALLMEKHYDTVHVRHEMVELAAHGDNNRLRNYKNSCVLKAREGTVLVSPFISPDEKQVMHVLLKEQRPFILLTDNGFRDYYKPSDFLFDACAEGRLLILSPWPYDEGKRHISRADCVALNSMAEEICNALRKDDHEGLRRDDPE